jgi:hypothetical protein
MQSTLVVLAWKRGKKVILKTPTSFPGDSLTQCRIYSPFEQGKRWRNHSWVAIHKNIGPLSKYFQIAAPRKLALQLFVTQFWGYCTQTNYLGNCTLSSATNSSSSGHNGYRKMYHSCFWTLDHNSSLSTKVSNDSFSFLFLSLSLFLCSLTWPAKRRP